MLRCLVLALLLHDAQHAAANSTRVLHEHRLRDSLKPHIAFDSYEYDMLNLTTIFERGARTTLPTDLLVFVGNFSPERLHRHKRESHSLIGTFDISKMFKKRKYKSKQTDELRPSASSLLGGQPFAAAVHPSPATVPALASATVPAPAPATVPTPSSAIVPTPSPVSKTAAHVFTIPTKIIPTEIYEATALTVSQATPKPKFKAKLTRKSKSASKTTPSVPNSLRREARPAAKKKASETESLWPVKHAAVVEGDIVLGGLMMVRLP